MTDRTESRDRRRRATDGPDPREHPRPVQVGPADPGSPTPPDSADGERVAAQSPADPSDPRAHPALSPESGGTARGQAGRPDIVAAARGWIGTPYLHQASTRGAGCDCLGLLRGVWREVRGPEPERPPAYTRDWSEPAGEERLLAAALRHLRPCTPGPVRSGDVLLFRMRDGAVAKHLGIATGPAAFVHAYSGHGVVESALTAPWARRIAARFAFPD